MRDRLDEFKRKLADLIEEYKVRITADDKWTGYPECGQDVQIEFFIRGEVTDDKYYEDALELLGTYLDPKDLRIKRGEQP